MKCEICDKEFANSVELEKHMERDHPMGEGDEKLEKPDLLHVDDEEPAAVQGGR